MNLQYRIANLLSFGFSFVEHRVGKKLPLNSAVRWKLSIKTEVSSWDNWFKTKGSQWQDYKPRFDANLHLQEELAQLLPNNKRDITILDVGAGPVTCVGKAYKGLKINLIAVDPLADEYDKLMARYNVFPPVKTKKCDAETLTELFSENSFDLVFARNCIDHSYSPEKAILEMLKVTKRNCNILLVHRENEAINENYRGMHQWNFSSVNGDFIISSQYRSVNISQKYSNICRITCNYGNWDGIEQDGVWLHVVISKF